METTVQKTRIVTLTDRAPVRIIEDEWPVIATGFDCDSEHAFQANRTWRVTVRRHEDGRTLVYGRFDSRYAHDHDIRAGYLLPNDEDVVDVIRTVTSEIGANVHVSSVCIANLPAEEI